MKNTHKGNTMQSNNVLDFVGINKKKEITAEDLRNATLADIEDMTDFLVSDLVYKIEQSGYTLSEIKDIGLIYETIRSVLMRSMDIDHFLQGVADKFVQVKD